MKGLKTYVLVAMGLLWGGITQNQAALHAQAELPFPDPSIPEPIDLGPLAVRSGSTPISITLVLPLRSPDEAASLMTSLHTPGDFQFHRFLTVSEFAARFGPTEAEVAKVISQLSAYQLTAQRRSMTTLRVTGSPGNMERAFAVNLHAYQVPAHGSARAQTFHAPLGRLAIPPEMVGSVVSVIGLNSRANFRPHVRPAPCPQVGRC